MSSSFRSRQFVLFLVTGGISAAINFCSRIALSHWLSYSTSIILAYCIGMITAYLLARTFVFPRNEQSAGRSFTIFALVNCLAIAQTWIISMLLAHYVLPALGISRYAEELAHAAGIAVPVFTSYLGHKYWSFADTRAVR